MNKTIWRAAIELAAITTSANGCESTLYCFTSGSSNNSRALTDNKTYHYSTLFIIEYSKTQEHVQR